MELLNLLAQSDFFKDISDKGKEDLAAICVAKELKKGQVLFNEGDRGHSLYILGKGNVEVHRATPEGREVVIKVIKPGEIFGEVILFEKDRYPASAVALKDGMAYAVAKRQFHCLLDDPQFRNDFIAMLMKKQRYLTDQIVSLSGHDVEDRFFGFLREQYGEREEYYIPLSKKDIASAIGTIPETLSRLLQRLKASGILRWEDEVVRLKKGFWK